MELKLEKKSSLAILIVFLLTAILLSIFACSELNLASGHSTAPLPEAQSHYGSSRDIINIPSVKTLSNSSLWPKRTLKVFPGAEGFGTETPAGRGGKIVKVTNLKDNGRGSLRRAINTKGPKIIVFEVAGTIELESNIIISHPYCTIAGQTAPPPGITIKNYGIKISAHDILIQHLRIRPGDQGKTRDGRWDNLDALQLNSGAGNVVIDHVSASWAADENVSTWTGGMNNVTFSNCIISEGLHNSIHTEQPHSKGLLIGPNSGNVSIISNLMAHNFDRVPQIQGGNNVVAVNNLIYEGGAYAFVDLTDPYKGGPIRANFQSNIFIDGPATSGKRIFALADNLHPKSLFFQQNNIHINRSGTQVPVLIRDNTPGGIETTESPISISGITVRDLAVLEDHVLATAGARPGERGTPDADPVDERIVKQVKSRTGKQIDCVEGCDNSSPNGWPAPQVSKRAFPIPPYPHDDFDADGYSNIEEVLHHMAETVEKSNKNVKWWRW
ncbi:hypothetical protein A7E78_03305 [Syntrophotalea acetylenivorans]|uniref:Pectate lyase n=1 Tax=Syntrophotalea acetylenivorans TaxID=1842532 RepID=A0A1L3GLZ3_9BACT|nr:hypothetical protein [Syntrophotalea acetylenivorans]APG26944.1 hypothetical protein A7E78_03305 [Syntrophotalea acetylenivorans]